MYAEQFLTVTKGVEIIHMANGLNITNNSNFVEHVNGRVLFDKCVLTNLCNIYKLSEGAICLRNTM